MADERSGPDGTVTPAGELAARLARVFHPESVLEVGCGDGALVGALRAIGVDAVGREADPKLLRAATEQTRAHLAEAVPHSPIDDKYDLIVAIDTLEHLDADEAAQAVDELCAHTDRLVLSTGVSATAIGARTPRRAPEDLAALLATQGFLRSAASGVGLLPSHTSVYERHAAPSVAEVVQTSERVLLRQQTELHELRTRVAELEHDLAAVSAGAGAHRSTDGELADAELALTTARTERDQARSQRDDARRELDSATSRLEEQISSLDRDASDARAELHERRLEVLRLRDRLIGREAELGTARGRLAEAESELAASTELSIRYQEVVGTRSWRLLWKVMAPYRWLRERLETLR